jgi:hypothetical protein
MNSEEHRKLALEIIKNIEGWELSDSCKLMPYSIVARQDKYAITFYKERGMLKVIMFLHPDVFVDTKIDYPKHTVRVHLWTRPGLGARILQERLIPKVVASTDKLLEGDLQ